MPRFPIVRFVRQILERDRPERNDPSHDEELLRRFTADRDEAAFTELVDRHGSLVLGVCSRVLSQTQDAEDAFQATFLVLARTAHTIRRRASLGSWLYGVASRIARNARRADAARRERETQAPPRTTADSADETTWRELRFVLDEELAELPEKYRAPLVCCYLEGKTQEEAARELAWSLGRLRRRLDRGRERLRRHLTRRGIAFSAAWGATQLAPNLADAVPPALRTATLLAAVGFGTVSASPKALALAEAVRPTFSVAWWKATAALMIALAGAAVGFGALRPHPPQPDAPAAGDPPAVADAALPGPEAPALPSGSNEDPLPRGALARLGTLRLRHQRSVRALAFSPDGKFLASSSDDFMVAVWEATTGRCVWKGPKQGSNVHAAAFSPDGKVLASTGAQGGGIQLWEAATGGTGRRLADPGEAGWASTLSFSPDGALLAVAGGDNVVRLWNPATGEMVQRLAEHAHTVTCVAFSPDGATRATADSLGRATDASDEKVRDCTILLWDLAAGQVVRRIPEAHQGWISQVSFAPDGKTLASASPYGGCLWNVAEGKLIDRKRDRSSIVAFAPDGKTIAWGRWGDRREGVTVCETESGKEVRSFPTKNSLVEAAAFSRDGRLLAAGGADGVVYLWKVGSGAAAPDLVGHLAPVNAVAASPDGRFIATAGGDSTVHVWGSTGGRLLRALPVATRRGDAPAVSFSPDSRLVMAGATVWDVASGEPVHQFENEPERGVTMTCLAFAPDGETLVAVGSERWQNQLISLISVKTGKAGRWLSLPPVNAPRRTSNVNSAAFSPDGKLLATGSGLERGGTKEQTIPTIHLWDPVDGKLVAQFRPARAAPAVLAFSPDGEFLVSSGTWEKPLQVWRVSTGKEEGTFRAEEERNSQENTPVAFSPDGRYLAARGSGNAVVLRELATGKVAHRLPGHEANVTSLVFLPDGRSLVSGSADTTALLWDLSPLSGATAKLDARALEQLWADLGGDDAGEAYQAIWALAAAGAEGAALLKDRLRPTLLVEPEQIPRLIADLDHEKFAERESAAHELRWFGARAEEALLQALSAKPTLEQRRRLETLLEEISRHPVPPEELVKLRAVQACELLAMPQSTEALEVLARGTADVPSTRAAKAALRRLETVKSK